MTNSIIFLGLNLVKCNEKILNAIKADFKIAQEEDERQDYFHYRDSDRRA